ncbi:hypothetical protein [Calothrix sp. NIES-2100]|uniref:hypothetical protein n=1 Tax=Calothrix sp. NIES-2100 TaxID=1954172 RepID=UPI0030D71405
MIITSAIAQVIWKVRSHSLDEHKAIHQKLTPLNPSDWGETRNPVPVPSPIYRGGLGWGKTPKRKSDPPVPGIENKELALVVRQFIEANRAPP